MMIVIAVGATETADAASKRELYQIHCGIPKDSVTSKMKKLSDREIISYCTGVSKYQARQAVSAPTYRASTSGTPAQAAPVASVASRSEQSGKSRRVRISGGSMAHVGLQDGAVVSVVAQAPRIGDHVVFSSSKCGGSGCIKTLKAVNAQGCIWVQGRPGYWDGGRYSVDSNRYGWICDYKIRGVIR